MSDSITRILPPEFKQDLIDGKLKLLLERIKIDNTLDLEIRNAYINIYYRGSNILRIRKKKQDYELFFDSKYLKGTNFDLEKKSIIVELQKNNTIINNHVQTVLWINSFHIFKEAIDLWITENPKDEREYQQVIVRENNYSKISNDTDYFICDIEYASERFITPNNRRPRIDMIGIKWPSTGSSRKMISGGGENLKLALFEMKYADEALDKKSGILEHIEDISHMLDKNLQELKNTAIEHFNFKRSLGLLKCSQSKDIKSLSGDSPEVIFILANHKPNRPKLIQELNKLDTSLSNRLQIKFAASNFMGYGLYSNRLLSLEQFKSLLTDGKS